MIKPLISIALILLSCSSFAQDLIYAKSMGSTLDDWGASLDRDTFGNIYLTGGFDATADMDPGKDTFEMSSAGRYDIFISKHDVAGNLVWTKRIGAAGVDHGKDLFVDASGNVFVTGTFEGTVDFDPGSAVFNLTGSGNADVFILKLNASGNFLWAKGFGGPAADYSNAIVSKGGNIYLTGSFSEAADFNPGPGTNFLSSVGSMDAWVLKLDLAGNYIWAKSVGGGMPDQAFSLDVDAASNVYVTGYFNSSADFDPGTGTRWLLAGTGSQAFILKLSSSGDLVWASAFGGLGPDQGFDIKVSLAGDIYTTGYFIGTADMDPDTSTFNLVSAGDFDIFILKVNSSGKLRWAKRMGGTGADDGLAICLDENDNIYSSGRFSNTADFDPDTANYDLTSNGMRDIYISVLDSSGAFVSATRLGGTSYDAISSMIIDMEENIYLTGGFDGTLDFDPGAGTFNMKARGSDIFMVKLGVPCASPGQPLFLTTSPIVCPGTPTTISIGAVSGASGYNWSVPAGATIISGHNTASIDVVFGKTSGIVEVYAFNSCGNSPDTSFSVLVPAITMGPVDQTAVKGFDVKYTVKAIGSAVTYQWQKDTAGVFVDLVDTGQFSGVQTDTLRIASVRLYQNFNVFRVITFSDGCSDTSNAVRLFVNDNVGLKEIEINAFKIYPNPASSEINIQTSATLPDCAYIITDISGRQVMSGKLPEISGRVDISGIAPGIYFIQTTANSGKPLKFIKQ